MQATPVRSGGVSPYVLITTLAFILLGSFTSSLLSSWEPFLVLGLMLLIGLPHGATDHGLFLALDKRSMPIKQANFYLLYTLVIAGYGLLWYLMPLLAFGVFMILSIYHFGQSNWSDVNYARPNLGRAHYLIWGGGVLLTPILLHAGEAASIVASMTDVLLAVPSVETVLAVIGALAVANLGFLMLCWGRGYIDHRRLLREVIGYGLLMGMFFTNSLLLGFTVYFVFWHSLASAGDQVSFFRDRLSPTVLRQLYLGILTTVGGAITFCAIIWFGPGPEAALRPGIIGGVFVFISLLTLPHMLLVEALYAQWSPVRAAPVEKKTVVGADAPDRKKLFTHHQRGAQEATDLTIIHT